jgi:hypothetical protein
MPAHPLKAASAGILLFVIGLAMAGGVYHVNRHRSGSGVGAAPTAPSSNCSSGPLRKAAC